MFTSFVFIVRLALAWLFAIGVLSLILANTVFDRNDTSAFFVIVPVFAFAIAGMTAFSHLRRVRLIAGVVNASTLSNRQWRQIEIPLEAGEAFDLIDAAVRELPGAELIESARDSLQLRAKLRRINPYSNLVSSESEYLSWLGTKRNQILATVTPGEDSGSVTLICEPERAAWSDWFLVDDGTNLENAEAVARAITRRIGERRRSEQASAKQSATEKELTVAKLSLLHAQVEPHFLYNTLASAQVLTRTDPASADQMLGNLITYLRHSLPRTEDALSTLGEELERARAYLDILKLRMGTRLQLQIDVPEHLKALLFPPMMLQTLVENAIKHGLEPKIGGGTVWILARLVEQGAAPAIAVTVADDGRGFSAEGSGTGIGLKNVRERLRLAFGAAASFAIVANFPSGVAATITLPATDLTPSTGGSHV